jgi:hypothetical protein
MRSALTLSIIGSIVAVAALMWPALYNGQPFFFADTITYIRGADAGLQKLTGRPSAWSLIEDGESAQALPGEAAEAPSVSSVKDKSVLSGRSVYYGALLYFGDRVGQFWSTVLLQAVLLMLAMGLFFKAFGVAVWPQLAVAGIVMGVLTSASFYVSFLMPDVFAAVTLLACASLIGARTLSRADYCLWTGLLAFSLISHSSHVLISAALLALALLIDVLRRSFANWRGIAVIAGCLVIAGAAESAFNIAVTRMVGAPPLRPPFLTARLIENGPGYRYLRETCPANGFQVCEFLPRLPMLADEFLWSRNPPGVFAAASVETRRKLSAEQYRFVWEVLRHDPMGVASTTIEDVLHQLVFMDLYEFTGPAYHDISVAKLPASYRAAFLDSAAYRDAMPTLGASVVQVATFGIGAAVLLAILARPRWRRGFEREQIYMLALVAMGVLINSAICGALSGPHDRYQTRVSWLIPFAALTAGFAVMARRWRRPAQR